MQIKLEVKGIDTVAAQLRQLTGQQLQQTAAKAINDIAFKVRGSYQNEMRKVFDRPTPYITSSVRVKQASAAMLTATVGPEYLGGKGVDPTKVLAAEVWGGNRRAKRSEMALRRAGLLPAGYVTAIPATPYPGSDDGRGNIKGSFILQLLTYFNAMGEQGYRANMTDKRRAKLTNKGKTASGYATINGVQYFASMGRLRGQHLAPGIWAKSGIHGSDIKPVLMFIRDPRYQVRLNVDQIAQRADIQGEFEKRLRYQIRKAAGV